MSLIAKIVVDPAVWQVPLGILYVVGLLALFYWLYFGITRSMARKRHRNPLGWILLSFFISPLLTWLILLIAGDKKSWKGKSFFCEHGLHGLNGFFVVLRFWKKTIITHFISQNAKPGPTVLKNRYAARPWGWFSRTVGPRFSPLWKGVFYGFCLNIRPIRSIRSIRCWKKNYLLDFLIRFSVRFWGVKRRPLIPGRFA